MRTFLQTAQQGLVNFHAEAELNIKTWDDARNKPETVFTSDGTGAVDVTGKTTLRQLAACIRRCSILVSTDSAGLHMGVAAGIPAMGIVGGQHRGRFHPWGGTNESTER